MYSRFWTVQYISGDRRKLLATLRLPRFNYKEKQNKKQNKKKTVPSYIQSSPHDTGGSDRRTDGNGHMHFDILAALHLARKQTITKKLNSSVHSLSLRTGPDERQRVGKCLAVHTRRNLPSTHSFHGRGRGGKDRGKLAFVIQCLGRGMRAEYKEAAWRWRSVAKKVGAADGTKEQRH